MVKEIQKLVSIQLYLSPSCWWQSPSSSTEQRSNHYRQPRTFTLTTGKAEYRPPGNNKIMQPSATRSETATDNSHFPFDDTGVAQKHNIQATDSFICQHSWHSDYCSLSNSEDLRTHYVLYMPLELTPLSRILNPIFLLAEVPGKVFASRFHICTAFESHYRAIFCRD